MERRWDRKIWKGRRWEEIKGEWVVIVMGLITIITTTIVTIIVAKS